MTSVLMPKNHQSVQGDRAGAETCDRPWLWHLGRLQAATVRAMGNGQWLLVSAGSVWVTQVKPVTDGSPPEDIWLAAGQSLRLPAHSSWVLEAARPSELSLVTDAPRSQARQARRSRFSGVWRDLFSLRRPAQA